MYTVEDIFEDRETYTDMSLEELRITVLPLLEEAEEQLRTLQREDLPTGILRTTLDGFQRAIMRQEILDVGNDVRKWGATRRDDSLGKRLGGVMGNNDCQRWLAENMPELQYMQFNKYL